MTSFKENRSRTQELPSSRKTGAGLKNDLPKGTQEQDSGMTIFKENSSRTQE